MADSLPAYTTYYQALCCHQTVLDIKHLQNKAGCFRDLMQNFCMNFAFYTIHCTQPSQVHPKRRIKPYTENTDNLKPTHGYPYT